MRNLFLTDDCRRATTDFDESNKLDLSIITFILSFTEKCVNWPDDQRVAILQQRGEYAAIKLKDENYHYLASLRLSFGPSGLHGGQ